MAEPRQILRRHSRRCERHSGRGWPDGLEPEPTGFRGALTTLTLIFASLLITLACVQRTAAQMVRGAALDSLTGNPIPSAEVVLLSTADTVMGRAVTDEVGRFAVRAPHPGTYRLRVTHVGYAARTSRMFVVRPSGATQVDLSLLPTPDSLPPISVEVRKREDRLVRVGFYQRVSRAIGYFRAPEDLDELKPVFPEELFFGVPNLRVGQDGTVLSLSHYRPCALTVAVDGVMTPNWNEMYHVKDIAAVEIYPRPTGLPAWISGSVSPCGAIIMWTR